MLSSFPCRVVWRGPRKTAMVKRFVKDTFWGRLDYLIFDILFMCIGLQSCLHINWATILLMPPPYVTP